MGVLYHTVAYGKNSVQSPTFGSTYTSVSEASQSYADCLQIFVNFTEPQYTDPQLLQDTYPLCFDGFAVMYSGITRSPLWAAEYLTRERLNEAYMLERQDSFHSESRLPSVVRANIHDYSGSGYDRGHLAPNADMATRQQQYDSFSLANIVPQSPYLNREVWRQIESSTRYLTKVYGRVYVVTGGVYAGDTAVLIGNNARIMVPTHIYKAIYVPAINQAGVYYAVNDESGRVAVISLDELAVKSGIEIMPAIDAHVKATKMALPLTEQSSQNQEQQSRSQQDEWWLALILQVFDWIKQQFN